MSISRFSHTHTFLFFIFFWVYTHFFLNFFWVYTYFVYLVFVNILSNHLTQPTKSLGHATLPDKGYGPCHSTYCWSTKIIACRDCSFYQTKPKLKLHPATAFIEPQLFQQRKTSFISFIFSKNFNFFLFLLFNLCL